jgi:hypothetical protein
MPGVGERTVFIIIVNYARFKMKANYMPALWKTPFTLHTSAQSQTLCPVKSPQKRQPSNFSRAPLPHHVAETNCHSADSPTSLS